MKWLLITNNGNPGDIWVRLGVQQIIRRLDEKPIFIIRERDHRSTDPHHGLTEPEGGLKFDYSVICGMPLLWCHREPDGQLSTTIQHSSWGAINGWCSRRPMIIAGFGILLACKENMHDYDQPNKEVLSKIEDLFKKCKLVYARTPLAKKFWPDMRFLSCPSVLALPQDKEKDLKLANFMPGGGHYPGLARKASEEMEKRMPDLAKRLIAADWHFAAHRVAEEELALKLGWPKERIHTWKYDGSRGTLINAYARCSKYFGNRIHGAIMSRAAGAQAAVIAYDTRLAAVWSLGGYAFTPFDLPADFNLWIDEPPVALPFKIDEAWQSHLNWWSSKLGLPIRQ